MRSLSRAGLIAAVVYAAFASWVVIDVRRNPGGFLPNMPIFLVTAPFSVPLSWIGLEPDLNSLGMTVILVAATTMLVYWTASAVAKFFAAAS